VPRVDYNKLSGDRLGESSATIRERVQTACHIVPNDLAGSVIGTFCRDEHHLPRAETGTIGGQANDKTNP
jgi:hypothetical protein